MDYNSLRDHVKYIRRSDIPEEADKYLIALIHHIAVTISDIKYDKNITWIKAHGGLMVRRVKSRYLELMLKNGHDMNNHFDLILDTRSVEDDTKVSSLDAYDDKLIVLRAAPSSLESAVNSRSPSLEAPVADLSDSSPHSLDISNSPSTPLQHPAFDMSNPVENKSHRLLLSSMDEQILPITPSANLQPSSEVTSVMQIHNRNAVTRVQSEQNLLSAVKVERPLNDALRVHRSATLPPLNATNPHNQSLKTKIMVDDGSSARKSAPVSNMLNEYDSLQAKQITRYLGHSSSTDIEVKEGLTAIEQEMEHVDEQELVRINANHLGGLSKITDVKHLEGMVRKALKSLSELESVLQTESCRQDVATWLSRLDTLKKQATWKRTVIGVVGNTGAGKSSVINALLGEKNLVPTSCMRACTAVVTELTWNESDEPHRNYRVEIEFITSEEWRKELDVLFSEMLHDGKISRDASNSESEAGIAYAKVKAVYPGMSKEDIAEASMDTLLKIPDIRSHLGTTKHFFSDSANKFYQSLQHFIDTKDNEEGERQAKRKGPRQPEWWPLIKRVRIYLKAEALSTGAVLVDLPGIQDSNAARAAVADGYISQCSDIWIVAPINRAVNDKAAKKLLSNQFKRQMKFDGMFSNVTFICSKTDDISVTEAIRSLHLEEQIDAIRSEVTDLHRDEIAITNEVEALRVEIHELNDAFERTCTEFNTWLHLEDMEAAGREVYAPRHQLSRKRKQPRMSYSRPKRRSFVFDRGDSDEKMDSQSFVEMENNPNEVEINQPLTKDEILVKIQELESTMQESEQKGQKRINQKKGLERRIEEIKLSKEELNVKQTAICIAARNEWSKSRIQYDYAMGIKDLDDECAQEEDEDNFDPHHPTRDYEQVAKSLRVFCVSSRAYQTLCHHFQADGKTQGFQSVDQTGIPQLKVHCMKIAENNRMPTYKMFLESTAKLTLSLSLWASDDKSRVNMSNEEQDIERKFLTTRLDNLGDAIDKATKAALKKVRSAQRHHIENMYERAVLASEIAALPRAKQWGSSQDIGGLHWSTYKAVVRYDGGPYTNLRGSFNFNKDLVDPLETCILAGWEKCFQGVIPNVLRTFSKDMGETLKSFHETVSERVKTRGIATAGMEVVDQKLAVWEQGFEHLADELTSLISERQKAANRDISPAVAISMMPVYSLCSKESGPGMFKRMKGLMESHIETNAANVFKGCTKALRSHLKVMRAKLKTEMVRAQDMILQEICKDYMNVIIGLQSSNEMTEGEKQMRTEVNKKVQEINSTLLRSMKDGIDALETMEEPMDKAENKVQPHPQIEQDADQAAEETLHDESDNEEVDGDVPMGDAPASPNKMSSTRP